jgi:hypothetical protein
MSLMDVLVEALIEDTNKYLNTITVHIHKKLDTGYEYIKNNCALDAQKEFKNAENHWGARKADIEQFKQKIEAIEKLMREGNNLTDDSKYNIACFYGAYNDLERACKTLDEVIKRTALAVSGREAAVQAQSEADTANKEALDAIEELIHPRVLVLPEASESPEISEISETIEPPHDGASHDMFMLSAFITALGMTAVAIAFAALNLAGLTMPGAVLGGFGLATTLVGCSMFASTATSVDEYINNMIPSFSY